MTQRQVVDAQPEDSTKPHLVRLGYGPEADDFITYIRYSMPDDTALGKRWREQLPVTTLRVRDPNVGHAIEPYEIQKYEPKSITDDEIELPDDLSRLVAAVKEYRGQDGVSGRPDAPELPFKSLTLWVDLVGQHCSGYNGPPPPDEENKKITVPRGPMDCLGDNPGDEPQISAGTYELDRDQVIAVVGTLGIKTGNATYTILSVNWFPQLVGVANSDDPVLKRAR